LRIRQEIKSLSSDEGLRGLVFEGEHISIASLPGMQRTHAVVLYSFKNVFNDRGVGYVRDGTLMTGIRAFALYSINVLAHPTNGGSCGLQKRGNYLSESGTYRERRDLLADVWRRLV